MHQTSELEPIVIPLRDPPPPPRLPIARRLRRGFVLLWPFAVWSAALALSAWLYLGESGHGHALAYEDIQEVRVSPAVAGRVTSLLVELGQKVREGDPVATLDGRDVDARLGIARAESERARLRVRAEREVLRLELEDRRARAEARRASYQAEGRRQREDADRLATDQAADGAELDALGPQIDRLKPLLEKKLITADRLEELARRRMILEQRTASRTDSLRQSRRDLEDWVKREPEPLLEPDLDARLLPYTVDLQAQEARVAQLELEREKCRVTAPVAGTVNQIAARPGEWLAAGAPIVQVVVPQPNRMTAYVTDRQISEVSAGTRATLRPHDHGGPALEGNVILAGPRIEAVPARLRAVPTLKQWGRLITIQVEKTGEPLPGQIYDVRFH